MEPRGFGILNFIYTLRSSRDLPCDPREIVLTAFDLS
jgi:hypothetical protein